MLNLIAIIELVASFCTLPCNANHADIDGTDYDSHPTPEDSRFRNLDYTVM